MPRKPVKVPGPHIHWLTPQQAALLAGIDRSRILGLIRCGALRRVTVPGSSYRLIPRMDVVAITRQMEAALEG